MSKGKEASHKDDMAARKRQAVGMYTQVMEELQELNNEAGKIKE